MKELKRALSFVWCRWNLYRYHLIEAKQSDEINKREGMQRVSSYFILLPPPLCLLLVSLVSPLSLRYSRDIPVRYSTKFGFKTMNSPGGGKGYNYTVTFGQIFIRDFD